MTTTVRCKFRVGSVNEFRKPAEKESPDAPECGTHTVSLSAVYASTPGVDGNACEENRVFGKWTPSGSVSLTLASPGAVEFFRSRIGRDVYLDFSAAD